ncbi:MarR family transcriptional regulator [Streptomyces sp. NPDC002888]|uniref:MarR family transcriptional regulator n=1 Tax=Streptomyces sp. NPDC002888 TaxID=3364668 RepID=UPI0036AEF348
MLLKLRAHSEAGGRIEIGQSATTQVLGLSRGPRPTRPLRDLDLTRLVKKQRAGVYQLDPMPAAYLAPEDAIAAVQAMPKTEHLNSPSFNRCRRAVTAYQDQLAEKRRPGRRQAPPGPQSRLLIPAVQPPTWRCTVRCSAVLGRP